MSEEGIKFAPDEATTSVAGRGVSRTATMKDFVEALRPWDWMKNGFVFSALIFSRNATHGRATLAVTLSAIVFCLASSAGYLFNDVLDMEEDRQHPVKRSRPVASGRLTSSKAVAAATVLDVAALAMAWKLGAGFFLVILSYVVLNALYSGFLKHFVLLDVFVIAAGFVLRVLGGGVVIHVAISSWLIVCTTLLALFLALGKRRHELVLLGAALEAIREVRRGVARHLAAVQVEAAAAREQAEPALVAAIVALELLRDHLRLEAPSGAIEEQDAHEIFALFFEDRRERRGSDLDRGSRAAARCGSVPTPSRPDPERQPQSGDGCPP